MWKNKIIIMHNLEITYMCIQLHYYIITDVKYILISLVIYFL
jgi:hypothetical protein